MKKVLFWFLCVTLLVACSKEKAPLSQQITLQETIYLTDAKQDSLSVRFNIEFPIALDTDSALRYVQQDILTHLVGETYASMPVEVALDAYIKMCQTEYYNSNKQLAERMYATDEDTEESLHTSFCEVQDYTASVMCRQKGILSYGISQYIYTGGAHGLLTHFFYNYETTTGEVLTEDDVFTDGYQFILSDILRRKLIEQLDTMQTIDDLYQSDYDVESIVPNGNFYLTTDGLVYCFNPYEIAPYSYGATSITLTPMDLQPILNPNRQLW